MSEGELKVRILAAASAARFAGLFETSKRLIESVNQPGSGQHDYPSCENLLARWIDQPAELGQRVKVS